jgi:hypothetical protein
MAQQIGNIVRLPVRKTASSQLFDTSQISQIMRNGIQNDADCRTLKTWAESTSAPRPSSTPAQVARHIEFLATTLPSRAQDFESGAKRMAVYARILGEYSDAALSFMSREACRRLDWFPTPHQCLQILEEYREPSTPQQQALHLVHQWASSKFTSWLDGLKADTLPQADIDAAPDQWKRIAAERCILRRMDDGSYIVRRKALA